MAPCSPLAAIEAGFRALCDEIGADRLFAGAPERQISQVHLHGGGGRIVVVHDLESALATLGEIVEQGEGAARTDMWDGDRDVFHPDREEVAHFYRFQELRIGRRYRAGDTPRSGPTGDEIKVDFDGILPMRRDPRTADHPEGGPIRAAQEEFNQTYSLLLYQLEQSFNGAPGDMKDAVGTMFALRAQAVKLMNMPTGDGQTTAGPTFEYVPPERRN